MYSLSFFTNNLKLRLTFEEESKISLLDISSLLYDINLLNDLLVISLLPDYKEYKFSGYFWYRKGRGIKDEHKLYLRSIRHESPIELVVIIAAASASTAIIWGLVQSFDKISNWRLNRKELKLEIEKLEIENGSRLLDYEKKYYEIQSEIAEKDALNIYNRILGRLEKYPFRIVDAKLYIDEKDKYDADIDEKE